MADPAFRALDYALALWRRRLSVIPVPRPGDGRDGKRPTIGWKRYQQERATEEELRGWFSTEQNIGVVTGAVSGVVVVDADDEQAWAWCRRNLIRTPWRVQTARGVHLYYRHPGVPVPNKARIATKSGKLALDVRGDGGYVIGPGSRHASGHHYQARGDWRVPTTELPAFWVGLLARPKHTHPATPRPRPTGDVVDRARRYLAAIPIAIIGQGSDSATLSAACRLVRGFDLPEGTASDLLWEWCGGRPGWTREWVESKVQNALRYGDEQIGGLR